MIKIAEGGLVDLWPERESVEIQALSYAIKQALDAARACADQAQIYANIDKLPEEILDHLAVEMRSMYYDQNLDVETKRTIIKNTLKWFTKAGTVSAVKELLMVVFGSGDIEEWFNYDGEPKHFNAVLPIGDGQAADSMAKFRSLIESIKNVRSQLDALIFEEETGIRLKTGESAYKTDPPLCGTFPYLSTAFEQEKAALQLGTSPDAIFSEVPTQAAETNETGTAPGTSTAFTSEQTEIGLASGEGSGGSVMPLSGEFNANE